MRKKLYLIVFTPGSIETLGAAIKAEIETATRSGPFEVEVTHWRDMFDKANPFPLNECIRKLHSFDGAIILLGASHAAADKQPINSNVLIEIGACMARYGRERVFLLRPRGDTVEIPYFYSNNVRFEVYDEAASGPAAIADAARNILAHLAGLGQSAYYSDLPAFGLAHGYFNNFMLPAIDNVANKGAAVYERDGDSLLKGRRRRKFSSVHFIEVVPETRIVDRRAVKRRMQEIGLVEAIIEVQDGRPISFTALPEFREKDGLYIIEVPTNLTAAHDAIEKIEKLWLDGADPGGEYRRLLEEREIGNFFRYLELLSEQAGLGSDKIRRLSVPSIEDLTIEAIRALAV
jgi:hypothetical protein